MRAATITAILANGSRQALTPIDETIAAGHTSWTLDAAALSAAVAVEVVDGRGNSGMLQRDIP